MNEQILIVRKYKGFGGIEHQILTFSKALINNGWRVFFLTDQHSPLEKKMSECGAMTRIELFEGFFNTARVIVNICKENNINIVQAHMLNEDFSCRLAKLLYHNIKHVFRVHTYIDCSRISKFKKCLYHIVAFLSDPLVDMYLPINAVNAEELNKRSFIKKEKIKIVHDAVRELTKSNNDNSYAKNRIIGMVANFEDGKGHDVLLEGVRILKERGERVTVHLIGGLPGRGTNNENPRRLDIVKRTVKEYFLENEIIIDGYNDNIPEALKECGIVVLPSDSEGTPNCLLEAMLLGKPVVASAVGGVPEFVYDGITGMLHKPQDAEGFADAIMRIYSLSNEEIQTIEKTAREYVMDHFSMSPLVDSVISEYCSLLLKKDK